LCLAANDREDCALNDRAEVGPTIGALSPEGDEERVFGVGGTFTSEWTTAATRDESSGIFPLSITGNRSCCCESGSMSGKGGIGSKLSAGGGDIEGIMGGRYDSFERGRRQGRASLIYPNVILDHVRK
jgi:hypothetical protein